MEQDIQSSIKKYLEEKGMYVTKVVIATKNGTPDLICCVNGKYLAFEIKRNEKAVKNAEELQKFNVRKIRKAGGEAFIVASLDEVKQIINRLKSVDFTLKTSKQNTDFVNKSSIRS